MPFVGDILQLSLRGQCFNQRIILVHTYRVETNWTGDVSAWTALGDVLTAISTGGPQDIVTQYLSLLPPEYTLNSIRAQWIHPVRTAYRANEVSLAGTNELSATVANDSAAITLRTANSGRDQVATKHIGPVPDSISASGLILAGYRADLVVMAGKLLTDINPATTTAVLEPVIFHRASSTWTKLLTYVIGEQSRVQRRRTVGLGE